MKKKIGILLSLVLVLTGIVGCSGSNVGTAEKKAEKHTIKIADSLNENSSWYKWELKFKEIVEKESNSRITVELYPSAQLGDNIKALTQVRAGTVEAAVMTTSNLVGLDKKWLLLDTAFLIPNQEVADKVFAGPVATKLINSLPDNGIIGLSYVDFGFRQLTNNTREIKSMADAKGLKIRTQETPLHLDAFKAAGMSPTPMPFSELFTALSQGAIDGQENPLTLILAQKFYEAQKYLTLTNHVYNQGVFMFSKKVWDSYTPEDQALISKAAKEAVAYGLPINRDMTNKAKEELKAKGMVITELEPEQLAEFRNATKDVLYRYQDQIGKELIGEFMAELDSYMK